MSTTSTRNKKFQGLVAVLGSEKKAIVAWNATNPDKPVTGTVPAVVEAPAVLTSKDQADVLVAQSGLVHTKGRTYGNGDLVEAQVRVLKTGKPEIVRFEGDRHTKGVVVFRSDDGTTFATQNLRDAN